LTISSKNGKIKTKQKTKPNDFIKRRLAVGFKCQCGQVFEIKEGDNPIIPEHNNPDGGSCPYGGRSVRDIAEDIINSEG